VAYVDCCSPGHLGQYE